MTQPGYQPKVQPMLDHVNPARAEQPRGARMIRAPK